MELNVKDVVFLLDKKTQNLVPCRVVEIISSVSLDGEKTYHVVEAPNEKKIKLEVYKGPWFPSIEDAQSFLMDTASSIIQKTVDKALKAANEHYGLQNNAISNESDFHEDESMFNDVQISSERVKIDLGNGQVGNISLPDVLDNEKNSSN